MGTAIAHSVMVVGNSHIGPPTKRPTDPCAATNFASIRPSPAEDGPGENMQNLSPVETRGTTTTRGGKWRAQAQVDGRNYYLGTYAMREEAAAVATAFRATNMPFSQDAAQVSQ